MVSPKAIRIKNKRWKAFLWILGILPIGFISSILTFYFHAGQILGRLPHYNMPDPKELSIYADYSPFINFGLGIWLISFPIWLIFIIAYLIIQRKSINWLPIIIGGIIQIIAIRILFSGIIEWYAD